MRRGVALVLALVVAASVCAVGIAAGPASAQSDGGDGGDGADGQGGRAEPDLAALTAGATERTVRATGPNPTWPP